jgi:hypothetical protein
MSTILVLRRVLGAEQVSMKEIAIPIDLNDSQWPTVHEGKLEPECLPDSRKAPRRLAPSQADGGIYEGLGTPGKCQEDTTETQSAHTVWSIALARKAEFNFSSDARRSSSATCFSS